MVPKKIVWVLALCLPLLAGGVYLFDSAVTSETASSGSTDVSNLEWQVNNFAYTNQDGKPFGLSNLKGDLWIANMIFTNCQTVCPPMTANMSRLQQELQKAGAPIQLVSFSVDPENDRPEVIKKFAEKFGADFSGWNFLTGYSQTEIGEFAKSSFKAAVQVQPDSDQVIHGTSFYLVDQTGKIVKKYDGLNPPYDTIIKDIQSLK